MIPGMWAPWRQGAMAMSCPGLLALKWWIRHLAVADSFHGNMDVSFGKPWQSDKWDACIQCSLVLSNLTFPGVSRNTLDSLSARGCALFFRWLVISRTQFAFSNPPRTCVRLKRFRTALPAWIQRTTQDHPFLLTLCTSQNYPLSNVGMLRKWLMDVIHVFDGQTSCCARRLGTLRRCLILPLLQLPPFGFDKFLSLSEGAAHTKVSGSDLS